jgi:hypothetical protein
MVFHPEDILRYSCNDDGGKELVLRGSTTGHAVLNHDVHLYNRDTSFATFCHQLSIFYLDCQEMVVD